jgi:hypothetical protein
MSNLCWIWAGVRAKSWRKAVGVATANAAEFEMWAGAISGKLSKGSQGLEIVDAGIQIFEKKPKLSPAESGGAET